MRSGSLLLLCLPLISACGGGGGDGTNAELITVGVNLPDSELSEFIQDLVRQNEVMRESGIMRGRLGMAYDANGFPDAAITTYR